MNVSVTERNELVDALIKFVKRVAEDENASPAEIAALPEIARVLLDVMPKA